MKTKANEMDPITITPVADENFSSFAPMLPAEIADTLKQSGFALGAIVDGVACGVVAAQVHEAHAEMLWIYVAPDYRRQYIGSTLFCELADFLEDPEHFDLEGISCSYASSEDDKSLKAFFDSLRFEQEETGDYSVRITLDELSKLGFVEKEQSADSADSVSYSPVQKLSPYHLNKLNTALDKSESNYTGVPVTFDSVLVDCSFVMYKDGNNEQPVGCLCFADGDKDSENQEKLLSILFIGEKNTAAISGMFGKAANILIKNNPAESFLKIPLVSESAQRMAEHILGGKGKKCESIIEARFLFKVTGDETEEGDEDNESDETE